MIPRPPIRLLAPLVAAALVLAVGAPADAGRRRAPPWDRDLVVDGGFESPGLAAWDLEAGACVQAPSGSPALTPDGSDFFLLGGDGGLCRVSQEIDLVGRGLPAAGLDAGARARGGAWLRGVRNPGLFDDQGFVRVRYLDGSGTELGSLRSLMGEGTAWLWRDVEGLLPPGTRRLRVEVEARHRAGAANDAMADAVEIAVEQADPQAPAITKQPVLQDVRRDAMTLLWETQRNDADHAVEWGPSGSGLTETVDAVETTRVLSGAFVHKATIPGLSQETEYDYRVRSGASVSPTYTFRTAPAPDSPYRVAWIADNQDGAGVFAQHVAHLAARDPDLVIAAGDVVQNGSSFAGWRDEWFAPLETLSFAQTTPLVIARGNHDREHALAYAYTALPGNEAWYAFRYGNAFVVVLDTEAFPSQVGSAQQDFLAAALASPEAAAATFQIVVLHRPPFTDLWHDDTYNGQAFVRDDWVGLFEAGGVDLVVSGHAHAYERGTRNGVTYVVVGGGGGSLDTVTPSAPWGFFDVLLSEWHYALMDVDGGVLEWSAYDLSDGLVDAFTLVR